MDYSGLSRSNSIENATIVGSCGKLDNEPGISFYLVLTDKIIGQSDYNLFFNTAKGKYEINDIYKQSSEGKLSLTKWQRMGYDRNSVIADPMFVDPKNDDYRFKPESSVFKLGSAY